MFHWWLQCRIDRIILLTQTVLTDTESVNKIYLPTLHRYNVYIPFHSSPACPFLRWLCVKRSLTKWNISFKNRSNWSILQYFIVGQCLAFAKQGQGKWSSPGLFLQQKSQVGLKARLARKLKICRTYYRKVTNTALRSLSWHRFHYKAQLSRCQRELLLEESLSYPPIGGQLRDHTGARTQFIEIYGGKRTWHHTILHI